jgi:hydrogenase maturation factor
MCLAFPAKVKEVSEKKIILDVNGAERQIKRGMLPVKVGDCVVIHANKVVDKLTEEQYEDYLKGLSEI